MEHPVHHGEHTADADWAAYLASEGEVMLPYVTETASWVAQLCRRDGLEVRRILDVGSGPGVAACKIARCFPRAMVVAVDESPAMLENTAARAEAAGLSDRITTHQANLRDGLEGLDPADLIWAAMVLHHVDNEVAVLGGLRSTLNPGGLLVLVEHADPPKFLAGDVGVGRPDLMERVSSAEAAWIASISGEYPALLEAAGFELIADRVMHVTLPAPLTPSARRVVLGRLQRVRDLGGGHLDEQDHRAVDVLIDPDHPLGIMRRADVFLSASRHVYVAKDAEH